MTYDNCIFQCATANSSVNTAIPSHESVQLYYHEQFLTVSCKSYASFHTELNVAISQEQYYFSLEAYSLLF